MSEILAQLVERIGRWGFTYSGFFLTLYVNKYKMIFFMCLNYCWVSLKNSLTGPFLVSAVNAGYLNWFLSDEKN